MTAVLDHVGFVVRDLSRAGESLRRQGFTPTEPVRLMIDGGWSGGTQQTVVLERGYLEFQEIEPGHGHPLEAVAATAPTVAVVAWRTDDLEEDVAGLRAAGRTLAPGGRWSRDTEHGRAQFTFATFTDTGHGPLAILVQHLTPGLTLETGAVQPNGVKALLGIRSADLSPIEEAPQEDWTVDTLIVGSRDPARTRSLLSDAEWGCRVEVSP